MIAILKQVLPANAVDAAFVGRAAPLVLRAPASGDAVELLVGNLHALLLGELEQLVGFFRNLHMNELKYNNRSKESIVMNDDETNMSNKKISASCIPPLALLLWYLGRVAQL